MRYFKRHYIISVMKKVNIDVLEAKWAIIFIIAYFVVLRKFFYSTCPVVIITGLPCPACGITRAAFQMINFDFVGALETHPFIYVIAFLMIIFIINRYIMLRKTPEWLKWMAIICIIGMILFYIWRMFMYFPGEPPMSYYSENLLAKIYKMLK